MCACVGQHIYVSEHLMEQTVGTEGHPALVIGLMVFLVVIISLDMTILFVLPSLLC